MNGMAGTHNLGGSLPFTDRSGVLVDDFVSAFDHAIDFIALERSWELVDAGITILRDAALTAITGTFTYGVPGTDGKYLSFTVANATAAGRVLSVSNGGLTWAAGGDTKPERILATGYRAKWKYTGTSASAGKAYLWSVWVPAAGSKPRRSYSDTP